MATREAERSHSELLELRRAAKELQRSLARGPEGLEPVHVGVEVTSVACKFIIIGATLEAAYKHAKELEDQGCTCQSSGETEFTCVCKD